MIGQPVAARSRLSRRGSCPGSGTPCNAACHEQDAAGEGCAGGCTGSGATGQRAALGAVTRHGQAAVSGVPLLVRRVVRPARVTLPGLCRVRHQAGVSVGIITAALHRSQRQRLPAGRWSGRTPAPRFANQSATPCGSMSSPGSSTRSGSGRRYSSACSTAIIRSLPVANFCRISPIGASPGTMR